MNESFPRILYNCPKVDSMKALEAPNSAISTYMRMLRSISVELMLNATDINFAVFNRFLFPGGMEGYFFALFSIAISAA